MSDHVRISGHYLLLGGKLGALLELKVSDSTGESKVAVDTAKVDKAAGGLNTCLLAWTKRGTAPVS